jgi:DNA-binding NarL/FixJ family response regulator
MDNLPASNDFKLLSNLKNIAPDTAIILMTAETAQGLADRALRLGVHRVLRTPCDLLDLPARRRIANQRQLDCANDASSQSGVAL